MRVVARNPRAPLLVVPAGQRRENAGPTRDPLDVVVEYLAETDAYASDIEIATGLTPGQVRSALSRGVRAGKIRDNKDASSDVRSRVAVYSLVTTQRNPRKKREAVTNADLVEIVEWRRVPRKPHRAPNPHPALDTDSRERLESGPDRSIVGYGAGVPDAVERALRAGAVPPLRYLGTGMTAHVFADSTGRAFKVSTVVSDFRREAFAREAAWLRSAGRSRATRDQVAKFHSFDPENVVIVREHVKGIAHGKHPKTGEYLEEVAQRRFAALEAPLLRRGWTVPEQKPESWRFSEEDPEVGKIFDAGMAWEVGRRLVTKALRLLKKGGTPEQLNDVMRDVRNEATHWKSPTIRLDVARRLLDALARAGGDPTLARDLPTPRAENPGGTTPEGRRVLRALAAGATGSTLRLPTLRRLAKAGLIVHDGQTAKVTDAGRKLLAWHDRREGRVTSSLALPASAPTPMPLATVSRHDTHLPDGRPWRTTPDPRGASPTYQYRVSHAVTDEDRRPPAGLLVSDMGTHGVPPDAIPAMPPGVAFYQAVDAHHNYADAERWLLAHDFGHARSWHYEALGLRDAHTDGEGHLVHRYLRLFRRGPGRGQLIVWDGSGPASGPGYWPPSNGPRPKGQIKMFNPSDPRTQPYEGGESIGDNKFVSYWGCAVCKGVFPKTPQGKKEARECAERELGLPRRRNPVTAEEFFAGGGLEDWRAAPAPKPSVERALRALAHEGVLTLPQIAGAAGLSIGTARAAVRELVARGLAEPFRARFHGEQSGLRITGRGSEAVLAFEHLAGERATEELGPRDFERMEAQALRARGVRAHHPSYRVGFVGQRYENPKGVPEGMKLRKGPEFAFNGEWLVTYLGRTFPVFHDKGGSGWMRTDIPGWYGTGSKAFYQASLGWSREEALLRLKAQIDGKAQRCENPCQVPGHRHPVARRSATRAEFTREFQALWRRSGVPGRISVCLDPRLAARHAVCERAYAEVAPATREFFFAPQALALPQASRRALIAHEIGHVLAPRGGEADADEAARRVLGVEVRYDPRWSGRAAADGQRGLQTTRRRLP
jgi:DNA-binding MarR family transcriptional regulator